MRKTAAILLLLVFFFNLYGYRIIISLLQTKADQQLEVLIDNDEYADEELVEMRVALNMPYQHRFTEFERHYGQITIDGKDYTYVKKKIDGDVLILKCIPNNSRTQLNEFAANIAKSNSDNTRDQGPVKSSVKIFSFECDYNQHTITHENRHIASIIFAPYADRICSSLLPVLHQPPQTA